MNALVVLDQLGRTDSSGRLPGWLGVPTLDLAFSLLASVGVTRVRVVDVHGTVAVRAALESHPIVEETVGLPDAETLEEWVREADWFCVDPHPLAPSNLALRAEGSLHSFSWHHPDGEWAGWVRRSTSVAADLPVHGLLRSHDVELPGLIRRHIDSIPPLHAAEPSARRQIALALLRSAPEHLFPTAHLEIAPGVRVSSRSDIHTSVRMDGPVWIGEGAVIEAGVVLTGGVVIHDRSVVRAGTRLHGCVVESGTWVRPNLELDSLWLDGESWWSDSTHGTGLSQRLDRRLVRRPTRGYEASDLPVGLKGRAA